MDWYFGYWTQQKMQLSGIYHNAFHLIYNRHPTADEKILQEIEAEFQKRVLQPNIFQFELEAIAQQAMNQYVETLRHDLSLIAMRYKIPKVEWDRYLDDIAVLSKTFEGKRTVPLALKAVVSYGSAIMISRQIKFMVEGIGRKVGAQVIPMEAVGLPTWALGKTTMKVMNKFFMPVAIVGTLIWDVLDCHRIETRYRPILKENIRSYFHLIKETLLDDRKTGIMAAILDMEDNVLKAMQLNMEK